MAGKITRSVSRCCESLLFFTESRGYLTRREKCKVASRLLWPHLPCLKLCRRARGVAGSRHQAGWLGVAAVVSLTPCRCRLVKPLHKHVELKKKNLIFSRLENHASVYFTLEQPESNAQSRTSSITHWRRTLSLAQFPGEASWTHFINSISHERPSRRGSLGATERGGCSVSRYTRLRSSEH